MAAPGEVSDFMDHGMKQLGLSPKLQHHLHLEFKHRAGKTPQDFSSPLLAINLTQPALIVHDRNDKDTQYQYSEKLHKAWKGSQLLLTDGLGHSLKSNDGLQKILAFLTSNTDK
jgi:pimeloyl-ACP methyl ester carboxylesterase